MGTPEQDLTPEEIGDPTLMQLWLAPYGTPLPSARNGAADRAFRFVGMVKRDMSPGTAGRGPVSLLDGPPRVPEPLRLALSWPRMLRRHAAVMPLGSYCSAVFGTPADCIFGVAPRVALECFSVDLDGSASCTAVLETDDQSRCSLLWFGAPAVAAS